MDGYLPGRWLWVGYLVVITFCDMNQKVLSANIPPAEMDALMDLYSTMPRAVHIGNGATMQPMEFAGTLLALILTIHVLTIGKALTAPSAARLRIITFTASRCHHST